MGTVVIIGDVGGFAGKLAEAADAALQDPDTVVIQVGDLVDRGPDSAGVLAYVKRQLEAKTGRWTQLIGNHEHQYLGGRVFWHDRLNCPEASLLNDWWLRERMTVATAVTAIDGEEFLISHAGLTYDAWGALGEPVTASTAADLLNTRPEDILKADNGPLWAEAGQDLYHSWIEARMPMPFSQIHGHSAIVSYTQQVWRCDERIRQRSTVDWEARHTFTRLGTSRFVAIDPKHGRDGAPRWKPFVLET